MFRRQPRQFAKSIRSAVCIGVSMLSLVGCSHIVMTGHPRSARFDPQRVSGLQVSDGPSGPRSGGPPATRSVLNTDGGSFDRLAALAISDIETFWKIEYPKVFGEEFHPVRKLVSGDGDDPSAPTACGSPEHNAAYCVTDDSISWDRSPVTGLVPPALPYLGPIAVAGTFAHEYGHAIQTRLGLPVRTSKLIKEQQADCYGGVYIRWVAEGNSARFSVSTGDGLSHLLAGLIAIRDDPGPAVDQHGTGIDRVSAFQMGFEQGPRRCSAINLGEINKRRGALPRSLFDPERPNSDIAIDQNTLATLAAELQQIFQPTKPPALTTGSVACGNNQPTKIAAYCPSTNTVAIDLPALQQLGTPASESEHILLQGDNTAISLVTSRYVIALQQERGASLDNPQAAMRTACLTGVAQRKMAQSIPLPSGQGLTLGAGDLDEAIAGLLTNGIVASDVNGNALPAGFTRVSAFRSGLNSDTDDCFRRF